MTVGLAQTVTLPRGIENGAISGRVRRHHRMPVSQLMSVRLGGGAPTVRCVSGHLGNVLVLAT